MDADRSLEKEIIEESYILGGYDREAEGPEFRDVGDGICLLKAGAQTLHEAHTFSCDLIETTKSLKSHSALNTSKHGSVPPTESKFYMSDATTTEKRF